ncbi:MAG TPA: nucleotide sugar dehydrogenase [Aestuariivirgaceae bacterium]|nr:nucleotide sugar dehydrogenase [Aestuariivirgaceae bacterium]
MNQHIEAQPYAAQSNFERLKQRIEQRLATVAVMGLGYVGLPLALRLTRAGFPVLGFDIDPRKCEQLGRGESYLSHIAGADLAGLRQGKFRATAEASDLAAAEIFVICVPTPLSANREPDLQYVVATVDSLTPHLRPGTLVSLESTTYPGTTEDVLRPRIEAAGHKVGEDVFLIYSPEREDPGNPLDARRIPKICGGTTPDCLALGEAFYSAIVDEVVSLSSTRAAEMTKLLENIHRAVNIGLVNEMKIIADRMDLDILEIIDAAATKPFGFVRYQPGPGLGGHCIPIDPFYLTWKARECGINTRFIELAGEINSAMPAWVVQKVVRALNDVAKPVRGSRIMVLGVAYKKNVNDSRETPAAEIMSQLMELGAEVGYSDPFVPVFPAMRKHDFDLASLEITAETLRAQDCVILVTDHDAFDYELIGRNAPLVVDTRGRFRPRPANVIFA